MKRDEKHRDGALEELNAETKMKPAVPSAAAIAASGAPTPEGATEQPESEDKKGVFGFIQGLSSLITLHPSDLDGIREKVLALRGGDYIKGRTPATKAALNQLLLQAAGATAPTKQQTDAIESIVGRE